MRNIYTQSTDIPAQIGGTYNPDRATLLANGWREEPPVPPVADGYTRVSQRLVEGDGETGQWEIVDRLTADIDAEAEQCRQVSKSIELKTAENQFLLVCQQLTGSKANLGFADLEARVTALMASDPQTATALSLRLLTLDAAGKREGGLRWWDDIAWHSEISE